MRRHDTSQTASHGTPTGTAGSSGAELYAREHLRRLFTPARGRWSG